MRECSTKKMSDTQKRAEVPPNITIRDKLLDCREELEAACYQLVQAQQRVHKEKVPFGRELHWKGIPERRFVPITLSGRTFEIHSPTQVYQKSFFLPAAKRLGLRLL